MGDWEEDAEEIRWVDDPGEVEEAFTDKLKRRVRHDSTCQFTAQSLPSSMGKSNCRHWGDVIVAEHRTLRHLRFLSIESPITDGSLPVLLGFENLDHLIVHKTELSEEAIEKLRKAIAKVSLNRWGD